jgi:anti-anti-sigma regulatory factor
MMEAVTPTSAPHRASGDAAAAPKLSIEKFADGGITCLKFSGTIDESFEGKKIARAVSGDTLVLDLGGVKKISSFGIREWVDFVGTAGKQFKQLVLIDCAPKVVDQLNMVANFAGGGRVFSFYAPFRCDYCDSEQRVLLDVGKDFETIKSMKLAERPCPSCKESMYFDEDGATYFSYMIGQGAFELDVEVVGFLAAKLDYRVGNLDSKLKVDKAIDGRLTYLRLGGDLNNTFPRDKLAEGLEGTVIVDLGNVPRVEPAGAAEWRSFVTQITPLVEQLFLVGVQPAFLEKLCSKDDLGAKAQVVSLTLPYTCGSCGTATSHSIDVAEHHAVLKFATAPELRCPSCKAAMQCAAGEAVMTVLPELPTPVIAKDVSLKIAEFRARKLEKKVQSGILPKPAGEVAPRSKLVPILLAAVLVVGGMAGVLAYQKIGSAREPGPFGIGPVVQASAKLRPSWIAPGTVAGAASCTREADRGAVCTGVSLALASQAEAEDEASDAAYEALGYDLAGAGQSSAWLTAVAPTILETRAAAFAAFARDSLSTQARRDLHEGRHAAARVLEKVVPALAARYWEAFDTRDGKKYVAFAEVRVSAADLDKLRGAYHRESKALGATVVDYYPELGWRYSKLEHGAIVTRLEHGPLQDLGLAEHYVVLAIDGRDVVDGASFAKIVNEEFAQLTERGGAFRLLVQTASGDPREFSATIPGPHIDAPPPSTGHSGHGSHGDVTTGGVNVWDRFGGNRGSGRDDPTQ